MLLEQIFSNKIDKEAYQAYLKITRDCKPWLNQTYNGTFYVMRGASFQLELIKERKVRSNRRPKDTPKKWHDLFNSFISMKGLTANNFMDDVAEFIGTLPQDKELEKTIRAKMDDSEIKTLEKEIEELEKLLNSEHLPDNLDRKNLERQLYIKRNLLHDAKRLIDYRVEQLAKNEIKFKQYQKKEIVDNVLRGLHGDDGTLLEAIQSGYEIMISCDSAYYVQKDFFLNKVLPLLEQRI